jgi:hypothetical protein
MSLSAIQISGLIKAAPAKDRMHIEVQLPAQKLRDTPSKEANGFRHVGARLLSNPHWCICTNHGTSFKKV